MFTGLVVPVTSPDQLSKIYPVLGTAVKVTSVPALNPLTVAVGFVFIEPLVALSVSVYFVRQLSP